MPDKERFGFLAESKDRIIAPELFSSPLQLVRVACPLKQIVATVPRKKVRYSFDQGEASFFVTGKDIDGCFKDTRIFSSWKCS